MTLSTAESNLLFRVEEAAARAKDAAKRRDERIREVAAEGVSLSKIAGAAGLSKARVHQIVHS